MSAAVALPAPGGEPERESAEFVIVTPDMAREWLGFNTRNRPKKNEKIRQYVRDIIEGRWAVTGEGVKFSRTGRLLDGQNRLLAIIEADKPVRTLVVRGLRDDAQDVMDSGAARSAADSLAMAGVKNAKRVTGAARIAMAIENDMAPGSFKATNSEVQRWVMDNLDITDAPDIIGHDLRLVPMPPAVAVYVAYRLIMVDAEAAGDFLTQLATGVGVIGAHSPVTALRKRLGGESYGATRRISTLEILQGTFRAWNAWREGRPLIRVLADNRLGDKLTDPK